MSPRTLLALVLMSQVICIRSGDKNDEQVIHRESLGRFFEIGALYNARTDNFCGTSIFSQKIPAGALTSMDSHHSSIAYINGDSLKNKVDAFSVSVELKVSVAEGLVKLDGSASFIDAWTETNKEKVSAIWYNVKTKYESVNIFHQSLNDDKFWDKLNLEDSTATHVVTGIQWGANCIVGCRYKSDKYSKSRYFDGGLKAAVDLVVIKISGHGAINLTKNSSLDFERTEIRVFGDIAPEGGAFPTNLNETNDLIAQLPSLIKKTNDGKGVPLEYRMIPISIVRKLKNKGKDLDAIFAELKAARSTQIVQMASNILEAKKELRGFYEDILEDRELVKVEARKEINAFIKKVNIGELEYRQEINKILIGLRADTPGVKDEHLDHCINKFLNSETSPKQIEEKIESWFPLLRKISFAKSMISLHAIFVSPSNLAYEPIRFAEKAIVLVYDERLIQPGDERARFMRNKQLFRSELGRKWRPEYNATQFVVIDCELVNSTECIDNTTDNQSSYVRIYENGTVTTEDLLEFNSDDEDGCGVVITHKNYFESVLKLGTAALQFYTKNYSVLGAEDEARLEAQLGPSQGKSNWSAEANKTREELNINPKEEKDKKKV